MYQGEQDNGYLLAFTLRLSLPYETVQSSWETYSFSLRSQSGRKKGRRRHKEKGTSRQKEEAHFLFSSDQRSDNTLLTSGTPRVRLWTTRWLVLHQ